MSPLSVGLLTIASFMVSCAQSTTDGGGTNVSLRQEEPLRGCVLSSEGGLLECAGLTLSRLEAALDDVIGQPSENKNNATDLSTSQPSEHIRNHSSPGNQEDAVTGVLELYLLDCDVPSLSQEILRVGAGDLETLAVVHSNLSEVQPDAFHSLTHSLTHVSLAYNHLVSLPTALAGLSRLQSLDLRHNLLKALPSASLLASLPRLRHLALSYNSIGELELVDNIPNLLLNQSAANADAPGASFIRLDLDHNGLSTFPEQFDGSFLKRLVQLDLSDNNIKSIKGDDLSQMTRLQTLDLSNNLLQELSPDHFPSSLVELDLEGNPWRCDCAAAWILESLEEMEESQRSSFSVRINRPACSVPLRLQDQRLSTLTGQDLCGNYTTGETKTILVGDNSGHPLSAFFSSLHLLNVTTLSYQAILVAWKVDLEFYKLSELYDLEETLSWGITVRTPSKDPRKARLTDFTLDRYKGESSDWAIADFPYTEIINGLDPNTPYIVCLTPLENDYSFSKADHCLQTRTSPILSTTGETTPTTLAKDNASLGVGIAEEEDPSSESRHYTIQTDQVAIVPGVNQITLSWNVTIRLKNDSLRRSDLTMQPIGWTITYREFGEENETEIILISRGGEALQDFDSQYVIQDLAVATSYIICFNKMSEDSVALALKEGQEDDALPPVNEGNEPIESHEGNIYYPDYFSSAFDGRVPSYATSPPVTPSVPANSERERSQDKGPFVYTSTGERIPLSGIGLPSVGLGSGRSHYADNERDGSSGHDWIGGDDYATGRSLTSNQRQTFTYEGGPSDSPLLGGQKYTYVGRRRKRAVEEDSLTLKKGQNESSNVNVCKEVVTLEGPFTSNIAIVISAVIAATSTLFVVCCIYCCCTRSCCAQNDPGPDYTSAISYIKDRSSESRASTLTTQGNGNEVSQLWDDKTNPLYLELGSSNYSGKNTCSISLNSSSGYVTPLPDPNHEEESKFKFVPDHRNSIDVFGCHLLPRRPQQQESRPFQFHPGYDVPPTSSNAALGYDYPKAVAVNTIGTVGKITNIQIGLPPKRSSKRFKANDGRLSIGKFALNNPFHQRKAPKNENNVSNAECCSRCRNQTLVKSRAQSHNSIGQRVIHSISVDELNQPSFQTHPLASKRLSTSAPNLTKVNDTVRRPETNKLLVRITTPEKEVNEHSSDTIEATSSEETDSLKKKQYCASDLALQIQDKKSKQCNKESCTGDFGNKVGEIMLTGGTLIEVSGGYVRPSPPKATE